MFLFGDYAWNQSDSLQSNVTRVRGWEELGGHLRRLAEKHGVAGALSAGRSRVLRAPRPGAE